MDSPERADLLCLLILAQLIGHASTGKWLQTDHVVEATRMWLASNSAECDWAHHETTSPRSRALLRSLPPPVRAPSAASVGHAHAQGLRAADRRRPSRRRPSHRSKSLTAVPTRVAHELRTRSPLQMGESCACSERASTLTACMVWTPVFSRACRRCQTGGQARGRVDRPEHRNRQARAPPHHDPPINRARNDTTDEKIPPDGGSSACVFRAVKPDHCCFSDA